MRGVKRSTLIVFFFILLSFIPVYATTLTDGITVYYTMDDDDLSGGFILDDVGSNDGNLNPTVNTGLDGVINEAFDFDSSGHIQTAHSSDIDTNSSTGSFTVSLWVNTTAKSATEALVYKGGNSSTAYWRVMFLSDDTIQFLLKDTSGDQCTYRTTNAVRTTGYQHIVVVRHGEGCSDSLLNIYVDGNKESLTQQTGGIANDVDTTEDLLLGIKPDGILSYVDEIDEFGFWRRNLSSSEITELYNSGNGLQYPFTPPPPSAQDTSLQVVEFDLTDFSFSSDSFVTATITEFNTTSTTDFSLLTAFNIDKLSVPGSQNKVYGRILVDNVVIHTELLRTVSGTGDEGSSGFFPLNFTVSGAGTHNITIQFRRTGNGVIEINDFDFQLIKFISGQDLNVRNKANTGQYTVDTSNLVKAFNWTINTDSNNIFIIDKQTISGTTTSILNAQFNHTDHNYVSPYISRYLSSSSDIGTTSNNWKHAETPADGNYSIMASTTAGVITVNVTVLDFDLQDSNNNTINSFQATNSSSSPSSPITLNAGSHLVLEQEFTPNSADSDSFLLLGSMSIQSDSGSQTPILVLNTTNTSLTSCFTKKERSLSSSSDIGNVYGSTLCENIVVNDTYTVQMWLIVPAGETVLLHDESFSGFQTKQFSISQSVPDPILIINTDLVNDTVDYNDAYLPINYNLTIGDGNTIDTFNCSLLVNGVVNETQYNRTDNTSYLFNYSVPIVEQDFTFEINCSNSEINSSTGAYNYKIDRIEPNIYTNGIINNTIFFVNIAHNITANVTCEDTNLFSCNSTIFEINVSNGQRSHIILNNFTENLTGGNFTFNFSLLVDSLNRTKYEWLIESWDDHNPVHKPHEKAKDIYKTNNYYKLQFKKGLVEVYSDDTLGYNIYDEDNKYRIEYTFKKKLNNKLYLKNSDGWVYRGNSRHKAHFVNTKLGKYFDLDSDYIKVKQVKRYLDDWEITLDVTKLKVKTNSIGDLNRATRQIFFNISEGFTFYAINNITGGQINNFTINVLNGTNLVQSKNTTIGNITFNITSGVYTTNITASGYANNNTGNLTFSAGGNYTYQMFAENSLFLFFYKEENGELIDDRNVTVKVINLANTSKEVVTDTGSAFISGFAPGDYEIIFNASGYMHNQYFTTITSSSTQTIDLYLVNNATGSLIVFNWADEKGRPITNAIMQRLRLVRISDNAYIVTGMSRTDDNGETSMNLEPNTVFYRFRLQDENGNIVYSGNSQQIFSNLVFFRVELIPDTFQSYSLVHGGKVTSLPIDWDNTTHIVSFTYSDTTGTTVRGCIRVIERTIFNENIYENCVNSSSATVQLNMSAHINNKSQYIAQGYIDTGTLYSQPTLQMMSISFGKNYQIFGNSGLFIAYLFIASMFLIGSTVSFSISVVFTVLSLLVTQMIGVSFFGWTLIVGIGFAGLFIAVVIKN